MVSTVNRSKHLATKAKDNRHSETEQSLDLLRDELSQLGQDLQALFEREVKTAAKPAFKQNRTPGRFKGRLVVGKQFFEPLTDDELKAFSAE
jgi:hypothetical protein